MHAKILALEGNMYTSPKLRLDLVFLVYDVARPSIMYNPVPSIQSKDTPKLNRVAYSTHGFVMLHLSDRVERDKSSVKLNCCHKMGD